MPTRQRVIPVPEGSEDRLHGALSEMDPGHRRYAKAYWGWLRRAYSNAAVAPSEQDYGMTRSAGHETRNRVREAWGGLFY